MINTKYTVWVLFKVPKHSSIEDNKFIAKNCSFYFKPPVFPQNYIWLYSSLQSFALVDILRDIQSDEQMVIFVMFQSDAISHQKESIWQPSIAKIYLWAFLELVLAPTNHYKIIKLIFGPFPSKVLSVWINIGLMFLFLLSSPYFFLPYAVAISIGADFIKKLFD